MGAGVVAVILSADHVLARPGWFSLFSLYNVLAFGGVALLWLRLRPSSRVGVLLLGITALTGLASLQGSSSPFIALVRRARGSDPDDRLDLPLAHVPDDQARPRERHGARHSRRDGRDRVRALVLLLEAGQRRDPARPLHRRVPRESVPDRRPAGSGDELLRHRLVRTDVLRRPVPAPARHPPLRRVGAAPPRSPPSLRDCRHVGRRLRRLRRGHGPDRDEPPRPRHDRLVADGDAHRDPARVRASRSSSSARSRASRSPE